MSTKATDIYECIHFWNLIKDDESKYVQPFKICSHLHFKAFKIMNDRTLKCVSSDKSCTINQYKLQTISSEKMQFKL